MAERLVIRNFAGLNLDIELGRINIFIGPQASGKSVCIKCAEFFKGFVTEIINRAALGMNEISFQDRVKQQFSFYFDLNELSPSFSIRYTVDENSVELKSEKRKLTLVYSNYYHELFNQIKKICQNAPLNNLSESISFTEDVKARFRIEADKHLGHFSGSWVMFVPASRALYSVSDVQEKISTDALIDQFRSLYASLRRINWHHSNSQYDPIIADLSSKILQGSLVEEGGESYLRQKTGLRTRLINSSSGQQEALPLIVVLQYLAWVQVQTGYSVFIEEPEAHLHPEAQHNLTSLIAAVYNLSRTPIQAFLTTHTPYLLSSFNNLIYAGQLASKLKKSNSTGRKKLYAAVPKELHMKLEDFRVYGLENGKATLLIDEESGLLMADSLDSVSDVIADQFGALMALDPATQPE